MNSKINVKNLTILAMLSAIAYLVMVVIRIPFIPALPDLKYDPKDIIIAIGGFLYGPLAAFAMSAVVSLIEMVTVSTTGPFGLVMNIVSTCAFVCTAAFIYKRKRTVTGAVIGLVSGVLFTTAVMILWNYIMTPIYYGFPRAVVVSLLIPAIMPFNLVKYGLNAAVTMLVYKPLSTALRKIRLLPETDVKTEKTGKINIGVILASLFVIATFILLMLVLSGKI